MSEGQKKIVIDARMVGPIGHGVSRYLSLIAKGLEHLSQKKQLAYHCIFLTQPGIKISGFDTYELNTPYLSLGELRTIPKALETLGADLYHSPSFASLVHSPCPWMVTIHDLNHLKFGGFKEKVYYQTLLKRFIKRSKAVISISEVSRLELSRWVGLPEDQIDIVLNPIERTEISGLSSLEIKNLLARYGLRAQKYFLTLSNPKPHKNLPLLVDSYRAFRKQLRSPEIWPLALTTQKFEGSEGVLFLGALNQIEAQVLLKNAGALLFPSIYEGFGRPPLEAAVEGVPIVVSDIPPHREALVDLAPSEVLWVKPTDFHGWSNAMHRVSRNEILGASSATQEKILKRYDPVKIATHMDQIYRRVLGIEA